MKFVNTMKKWAQGQNGREHAVPIFDAKSSSNRYAMLDCLRFLACVSVLVWHYQHFFYLEPGFFVSDWMPSLQPFFALLAACYQWGRLGVQVFWTLSGFVFFALFSRKIHDGTMPFRTFAMDRFSRLYPMHLLSLTSVSLLVCIFRIRTGNDGIYPHNDLYHFFANLVFLPTILPNKGMSFNAPVWSVSLELVSYSLFFLFAKFVKPTLLKTWGIAAVFFYLQPWPQSFPSGREINQCVFLFFSGGGIFLLLRTCSLYLRPALAYLLLVGAGLIICAVLHRLSSWIMFSVLLFSFPFPLPKTLSSLFSLLGGLTYAAYLLHVPIQLGIMLVVNLCGNARMSDVAVSPLFAVAYYVTVWGAAALAYRCFELPTKRWLRTCLGTVPAASLS